MKTLVAYFVSFKISLFLLIFLAFSLLPHAKTFHDVNFLYPENAQYTLQTAFTTWDAQHYLFLADKGYKDAEESVVFFPLYPLLTHIVSFITRNTIVAGLIVSNLFSFGVLYYLYKFAQNFFSQETAQKAVMLFLVFPTAFYLSLVYTESLFLFLVLGFFYYLFKKQYYLAGLFTLFIPMARPVGIFIILPFLLFYILDKKKKYISFDLPSFNQKQQIKIPRNILVPLFPLIGLGAYFFYMHIVTGNFFSGFSNANLFIGGYSITNILSPTLFFQNLFTPQLSLHLFTTSVIDRIFFVCFITSLPFIYRFNKTLFIYSLSLGMVPLFGSFMGYIRYLLPVFPLFFVLSQLLEKKKWAFLYMPLLFFLYSLQVFFIVLYALNYWVS